MRLPVDVLARSKRHLPRALFLLVILLVGGGTATAAGLLAASSGRSDRTTAVARPAPVLRPAAVPAVLPAASQPAAPTATPAVKRKRPSQAYYRRTTSRKVAASDGTSFIALYKEASRTFGVAWQLIASVHRQETAFSTVDSTYKGLNAFGCCAGPMQFNVKNGPVSTWTAYKSSFKQGTRPRAYPHRTSFHPSIYDDFDAIMAAGALLRDGGATPELGSGSWLAAYGYYGRDLFGITYASQVVGRAQGWARKGFCPNCGDDPARVAALDDAYGVSARQELLSARERRAGADKAAKKKRAAASKRKRDDAEKRAAAAKAGAAGRAPAAQGRRKSPPRKPSPAGGERPAAERKPARMPPPSGAPAAEPTPPAPAQGTPQAAPPAPPPAKEECTALSSLGGCGG